MEDTTGPGPASGNLPKPKKRKREGSNHVRFSVAGKSPNSPKSTSVAFAADDDDEKKKTIVVLEEGQKIKPFTISFGMVKANYQYSYDFSIRLPQNQGTRNQNVAQIKVILTSPEKDNISVSEVTGWEERKKLKQELIVEDKVESHGESAARDLKGKKDEDMVFRVLLQPHNVRDSALTDKFVVLFMRKEEEGDNQDPGSVVSDSVLYELNVEVKAKVLRKGVTSY